MLSLSSILPETVAKPMNQAIDLGNQIYQKAQPVYQKAEEELISFAQKQLPASLKPLASKVVKAIPETLFCVSMFTGVGTTYATLFWAAKTCQIVYPIFEKVTRGSLDKPQMLDAAKKSNERFVKALEGFTPAIFASSGVGAFVCTTLGLLKLNPTMLMQGSFFAVLARVAYEAMTKDAPQTKTAENGNGAKQDQPQIPTAPVIEIVKK